MADETHDSRSVSGLITLSANGDQVFVWNADEAFILRSKYRIIGALVGSLPRKPNQNLYFSLPLVLLREEVTLLLEKGLARIVNGSELVYKLSAEEVETFNTLRDQSVRNQLKLFQKERQEKESELSHVIESGRKRKRKTRKDEVAGRLYQAKVSNVMKSSCEHDELHPGTTNEVEDVQEWKKNTTRVLENLCSDSKVPKRLEHKGTHPCVEGEGMEAVHSIKDEAVSGQERSYSEVEEIHMKRLFADEKSVGECADAATDKVDKESLESQSFKLGASAVLYHIPTTIPPKSIPQQVIDWTYPNTLDNKLHYKVFLDLWEKGYYITSGAKFGGDYLAYPGDPSRFHSFYIIIVLPWERKVTPFDIISLGRLGSTVKKTAVFCSVCEDGRVTYTSVKWTGIS